MPKAKKILIVVDDPDLVEAVTMILESKNYDVAAAYGGIEGLQKAKTEKPDLIVLDGDDAGQGRVCGMQGVKSGS